MKRLCFLSPDADQTRRAVAALRQAGVIDPNLMVIARHDIPLEELPPAGIESTDAIPGLGRGLAAGGVVGAIAGLVILSFEELGVALGGAAIPLFTLLGAGIGGLSSLLGGASLPSSRLHRFQDAIEREGKLLLMVDVKEERVEEIKKLVHTASPAIEFVGLEPPVPLIPP